MPSSAVTVDAPSPNPKKRPNRGNRENWGGKRDNQTGRPTLKPEDRKTAVFRQRVTPAELAKLRSHFSNPEKFHQFIASLPDPAPSPHPSNSSLQAKRR